MAIKLTITRLEEQHTKLPFICDDPDLEDFLRSDALRLQEQKIAATDVAMIGETLVGYVSVLTDSIELKSGERRKLGLTHHDHHFVPAMKIARLAVALEYQGQHIGQELVGHAATIAIDVSASVGCRLITVDAYWKSRGFYTRLGFVRNSAKGLSLEKIEDPEFVGPPAPATMSMRLDMRAEKWPQWLFEHFQLAAEDTTVPADALPVSLDRETAPIVSGVVPVAAPSEPAASGDSEE